MGAVSDVIEANVGMSLVDVIRFGAAELDRLQRQSVPRRLDAPLGSNAIRVAADRVGHRA